MSKEALMKEVDSIERFDIFNRMWISEKIEEALKKEEITPKEKVEINTYIADLMEMWSR